MTKAEEHTPGPWEVSGTAVLTSGNPVTQKAICRILGPQDMGPSTEEGYHNARLIASAPDMKKQLVLWEAGHRIECERAAKAEKQRDNLLEALKALFDEIEGEDSEAEGMADHSVEAISLAKAAIRAAGGQL